MPELLEQLVAPAPLPRRRDDPDADRRRCGRDGGPRPRSSRARQASDRGEPAPWAGSCRPSVGARHWPTCRAGAGRRPGLPAVPPLEGTGTRPSAVLAPLYEHDGEPMRGAHPPLGRTCARTGRGQLPRRWARGRRADLCGHRRPRGARGGRPRSRRSVERPRRARPPPDRHQPLAHRPLRGSAARPPRAAGRAPTRSTPSCTCRWPSCSTPTCTTRSAGGWRRSEHPIFFFELDGDTVWGATAAMLRNLLLLITSTS